MAHVNSAIKYANWCNNQRAAQTARQPKRRQERNGTRRSLIFFLSLQVIKIASSVGSNSCAGVTCMCTLYATSLCVRCFVSRLASTLIAWMLRRLALKRRWTARPGCLFARLQLSSGTLRLCSYSSRNNYFLNNIQCARNAGGRRCVISENEKLPTRSKPRRLLRPFCCFSLAFISYVALGLRALVACRTGLLRPLTYVDFALLALEKSEISILKFSQTSG